MTREVAGESGSSGACLLRLVIVGLILAAVVFAVCLLFRGWRMALTIQPDGELAVNPNLSVADRLYLESYLAGRQAELQAPAGAGSQPVAFTITPGEGARAIATNLASSGLLRDPDLFVNYLAYYGLDSTLVAGQYTLDPQATIPGLAAALSSGTGRGLELSFLPGWRSEEMANYLQVTSPGALSAGEFLDAVRNPRRLDLARFSFLGSLPAGASLEGFLHPGRYSVDDTTSSSELVEMMLARFDEQVTPALRQLYGAQGLSVFEAVTLASILEKEALIADEKPIMAGIFLNRLRAGMPLQSDPTVQYALGDQTGSGIWWKSPLSLDDLQVSSPYNTYQVNGLPPGPISNPGQDSLNAVAYPAGTPYLFFVLDCAAAIPGTHAFSVTYEEHLANVQRCR